MEQIQTISDVLESRCRSQCDGDRDPACTCSITKNGRPWSCSLRRRTPSQIVRVIHQRKRLTLRLRSDSTTCLESIPRLMIFRATLRRTGFFLLGFKPDLAHPALAEFPDEQTVVVDHFPVEGEARSGGSRGPGIVSVGF